MSTKKTGRGMPQGASAVFQPIETDEVPLETARPKPVAPKPAKPPEAENQPEKVKTSIYISEETQDMLHSLKRYYRKQAGKNVPAGDVIEMALKELVKVTGVTV